MVYHFNKPRTTMEEQRPKGQMTDFKTFPLFFPVVEPNVQTFLCHKATLPPPPPPQQQLRQGTANTDACMHLHTNKQNIL